MQDEDVMSIWTFVVLSTSLQYAMVVLLLFDLDSG